MHCLQVKGMAEKLGVHINWKGRQDHLDPVLQDYQVRPASLCLRRCSYLHLGIDDNSGFQLQGPCMS